MEYFFNEAWHLDISILIFPSFAKEAEKIILLKYWFALEPVNYNQRTCEIRGSEVVNKVDRVHVPLWYIHAFVYRPYWHILHAHGVFHRR